VDNPTARVAAWLRGYLLVALVITNLWTQFAQLQWGIVLLLGLSFLLDLHPEWFVPAARGSEAEAARPIDEIRQQLFPGGLTPASVALGLAICAPVFAHVVLTRHEEFPFAGDEGYEVSASRSFAILLKDALPWVVAIVLVVFGVVRRFTRRFTVTIVLAALFAASFRFAPNDAVARYPGTFYFLATPFNVLAEVLHWKRAFFSNHVVNALSVSAWLFGLRPILVRRWPDLAMLPLAAALFFQKEVVYVFGGGQAIEPWAFVLLLIAFESLFTLSDPASWFAYFLMGWSFMTKEPGVFLFPLVWLVAVARTNKAAALRHVACGLVVLAPFMVYYVVRRRADVVRQISFQDVGAAFSLDRLSIWGHRVVGEFGALGVLVPAGVAAYALLGLVLLRDRRLRQVHAALVAGAIGLLTLYFTEDQVLPWIAYSRYMLYPLILVSLSLLSLTTILLRRGQRTAVVALGVAIVALQAGPLARNLSLDLKPDYERNSLEWARIPIFYPVRALIEPMSRQPVAESVRTIRLVTPGVDPVIAPVVYPDFRRRFSIDLSGWDSPATSCHCAPSQAVFVGFQYRAGLALQEPEDLSMPHATDMCLERLHTSCGEVRQALHQGVVVGALGIPRR
jgi:hypothetical protein